MEFPKVRSVEKKTTAVDSVQALCETVARLRAPDGCPWDREQTHLSLAECLIEETAELLETIDKGDMGHMREELGDVLLQVVFHAHLAQECGHFDLDDVATDINEKLIRRHPHVFGEDNLKTSEDVLKRWDEIKAQEKQHNPQPEGQLFKDPPARLPALLFARDVIKQMQKKGLVAPDLLREEEIEKESPELSEEVAGQRLFHLVAACRKAGIDPESALRRYSQHVMDKLDNV